MFLVNVVFYLFILEMYIQPFLAKMSPEQQTRIGMKTGIPLFHSEVVFLPFLSCKFMQELEISLWNYSPDFCSCLTISSALQTNAISSVFQNIFTYCLKDQGTLSPGGGSPGPENTKYKNFSLFFLG